MLPVTDLTPTERELQEALRVQRMSPSERQDWLGAIWGRLQRQAAFLYGHPRHSTPQARSFATPDEKNACDEARELDFALAHSPINRDRKAR
jgi:hypothetical protein